MKVTSAPTPDFDIYIAREGTTYAEREPGDAARDLYAQGFLPYSGTKGLQNIYYSARSARIVLNEFELSSENRRIARKFDGMFTKTTAVGAPPKDAYDFCLAYFSERHGPQAMPHERLELIFSEVTHTATYRSGSHIVAYVVSVEDPTFGHYWYSFYDLSYAKQSLGLWLMLDGIRDAKVAGKSHYYLGTVYGEKALYKTNFAPLEWWDGTKWNNSIPKLKGLAALS